MSTFFENKNRNVIPNFRNLRKTVDLGELSSVDKSNGVFQKDDLNEYYKDFLSEKSIGTAGDLISASIVNNLLNAPEVKEAARFIIENIKLSSPIQIMVANRILYPERSEKIQNIDSIEEFTDTNALLLIYLRLKSLKGNIKRFERNPFLYTEIARLYSMIGLKVQAIKNISIAKSLAPHNRYILRSYARLLAHFDQIELAHHALKSNNTTKNDPWLLASEIAFASSLNKTSNFLKIGKQAVSSRNFSAFNISELASSLGTFELKNGSRKLSKSFFQQALVSPNDNSLAQIEWVNNSEGFFDLNVESVEIENKFEALTLDSYNSLDWDKTVKNAGKWFIDMPFAKRPIMYGHHVAATFLDDQETAIKFCKAGLLANPNDPQIINNISYSLAINNDPTEAFKYLNKIDLQNVKENHTRVCILATTGLAYYRSGFPDIGRDFYKKSIEVAEKHELKYYYGSALLNIAREEILIKSEYSTELYNRAMEIDAGDNLEFKILKDRLKDLMAKNSQKV